MDGFRRMLVCSHSADHIPVSALWPFHGNPSFHVLGYKELRMWERALARDQTPIAA